MICPFCQHDTTVYNSRLTSQKQQVWRRRRCTTCNQTFSTKERVDWNGVVQVASSTGKQPYPYSRDRLQLSVARACRPLIDQYGSVNDICDSIEYELQRTGFFSTSPQAAETITVHTTHILHRYHPSFAVQYVQHVYQGDPPVELLRTLLANPG